MPFFSFFFQSFRFIFMIWSLKGSMVFKRNLTASHTRFVSVVLLVTEQVHSSESYRAFVRVLILAITRSIINYFLLLYFTSVN